MKSLTLGRGIPIGRAFIEILTFSQPRLISLSVTLAALLSSLFYFTGLANAEHPANLVRRTLQAGQSLSVRSHRCLLSLGSTTKSRVEIRCSRPIATRFQKRPSRPSYLTPKQKAVLRANACSLEVESKQPGRIEIKCSVFKSPTPLPTSTPVSTSAPAPTATPTSTSIPAPTATPISQRQVGGTLSGLSGTVILQNNGADNLSVSSNGSFAFAGSIAEGSAYNITVLTQPAIQICTITSGSGIAAASDITNVSVTCATNQFTVTSSAGANGSINPSGSQGTNQGSTLTFTATPDSGYGVNQWLVDGNLAQSGGNTYQLNNISSNHAVSVTFGTASFTTSVSSLALSINCLPASTCTTTQNSALTGNPRDIIIQNTGVLSITNISVSLPILPSGTSVTSTCGSTLSAGSSCTITLTPGSVASSDLSSAACTSGTQPEASVVTVTADGGLSAQIDTYVLGYGCVYEGGFIYSIDDSSPSTSSILGKVITLVDQAEPFIFNMPQATSIVWSSDGTAAAAGDFKIILGIDEQSTLSVPSPTSPAYPGGTPAYTACNGSSDGQCNSSNIVSYYNFNRVNGGSAPTPLSFYAAGLCSSTINTYSNWYLPSICELDGVSGSVACPSGAQSVLENLTFLLGVSCAPPASTNCIAGYYWSSTEFSSNPQYNVWIEVFQSVGSFQDLFGKDNVAGVRCARDF